MLNKMMKGLSLVVLIGVLTGCSFHLGTKDSNPVVFTTTDLSGNWYRYDDGKKSNTNEFVEEVVLKKAGSLSYSTESHKQYTLQGNPEKQSVDHGSGSGANDNYVVKYISSDSEKTIESTVYDIVYTWAAKDVKSIKENIKTIRGEQVYDSKEGREYDITTEDGTDVLVSGDEKWYRSKEKAFGMVEDRKIAAIKRALNEGNRAYPFGIIEIRNVKFLGK